ncbi:AcrR family transcriptional regulator [Nocardioides ginsengisegetis]|uniref:AcrR family transcriptional regulator n=1 Tax=Nocardioides ginsengisegetis TaxID=661491 RepID=A0A7W3IY95_9ACTN|nr:TetR/AcrR family transcriptional regulator [Nocardioides ginsengisegetis]MBA8802847.1 AcrR family transcriptional regulator [Nocardioides ginsengisegetis]
MKTTRTYTMGARAEAVAETRRRIIDALFDLGRERMFPDISLEDVADAAGVSVQTILRHFKSRAGLAEATMDHAITTVTEERHAPVGDVDAAVAVIIGHYEDRGHTALMMLAQESSDPQVAELTRRGRAMHRTWVREVFAPFVGPRDPLIDLLVVATDVYTWKLLRLDRRYSRTRTERLMHRMVTSLLEGSGLEGEPS